MLPLGKKIGAKHMCAWLHQKWGGGSCPRGPPSPFLCHCLLLHARHAASKGYHVVVRYWHLQHVIDISGASLFHKCGMKNLNKGQPLTSLELLPLFAWEYACRALISLHSYTGWDTVSAFAGQKAKLLKLLIQSTDYQDMFLKNGIYHCNWQIAGSLYVLYVCPYISWHPLK